MRYVAPPRGAVQAAAWRRPPLSGWRAYAAWLEGEGWPAIDDLNAACGADMRERFVAQTRELLADGLHYEQRIAERGLIATRERNWHDLFNALIWLRYGGLKQALNARQVAEIASVGAKLRSRAQCALTHFDEAGALVGVRDPDLLALWDAHDWHGLFWRRRQAWLDGSIELVVFGHALLEHALSPDRLLVGKALAYRLDGGDRAALLRIRDRRRRGPARSAGAAPAAAVRSTGLGAGAGRRRFLSQRTLLSPPARGPALPGGRAGVLSRGYALNLHVDAKSDDD